MQLQPWHNWAKRKKPSHGGRLNFLWLGDALSKRVYRSTVKNLQSEDGHGGLHAGRQEQNKVFQVDLTVQQEVSCGFVWDPIQYKVFGVETLGLAERSHQGGWEIRTIFAEVSPAYRLIKQLATETFKPCFQTLYAHLNLLFTLSHFRRTLGLECNSAFSEWGCVVVVLGGGSFVSSDPYLCWDHYL